MAQLHKPPAPPGLGRAEFHERFARSFADARFDRLRDAVAALEEVAWRDYCKRQEVKRGR